MCGRLGRSTAGERVWRHAKLAAIFGGVLIILHLLTVRQLTSRTARDQPIGVWKWVLRKV